MLWQQQNSAETGSLHAARAQNQGKEQTRIASSREDLANCYRLVYKVYLKCGYTELKPEQMRINLWNTLPGTHTILAEKQGNLAGTLTCVMDSEAGLPADGFCSEELQKLRANGRRLCEVSGLAIDRKHASATTVLKLLRYALTLTKDFMQGTDFIITVHPRHAPFYEDLLLFEKLKKKPQYASVKGAPGVLMRINLDTARERYHAKYSGRSGRKDLEHFYFVRDKDKIVDSIRAGLAEKQRWLDDKALETLLLTESQLLTDEHAFRTFRNQWDNWNRAF